MSVGLYMNVHIRRQITEGLRQRGVDVLTAQEDGTTRLPDSELLDRATELGRVLVTEDRDLLREAARR
jgi:predicted nuclease of predicted toxin-antitoxin system